MIEFIFETNRSITNLVITGATPLLAGDMREQVLTGNAVQLLPSLASTAQP